jgi:hypothetical protein
MLPLPPLKCVYLVAKKVDLPKLWRQISQPVYFGLVGFVDAVAHAAVGVCVSVDCRDPKARWDWTGGAGYVHIRCQVHVSYTCVENGLV